MPTPDYAQNPIVSLEDACNYIRQDVGVDDELIEALVLSATGHCQHETGRTDLTVGGTDDLWPAISATQFAQIQLWIKAHACYWYNNREAFGNELKTQPAFHHLIDSVRTYA